MYNKTKSSLNRLKEDLLDGLWPNQEQTRSKVDRNQDKKQDYNKYESVQESCS